MIAGFETVITKDDEYKISGSANGINSNGVVYTTENDGIVYKNTCERAVSGTVKITSDNKDTSIDFGGE